MKNQQISAQNSRNCRLVRAGGWFSLGRSAGGAEPDRPDFKGLIYDAGVLLSPGQPTITGPFNEVLRAAKRGGGYELFERPDLLALPGLVNAHVHFDLHVIGPRPYPGSFIHWLSMVIQSRANQPYDPAQSVNAGLAEARSAGHCAAGDIAGSMIAAQARIDAGAQGLAGVSYLETLGFDAVRGKLASENNRRRVARLKRQCSDADRLASSVTSNTTSGLSIGIEPHAPYSTHAVQYRRLNQPRAVRRCTHLAETLDEVRFVREGTGPFKELLKKLGRWDDQFVGTGLTAVGWLNRIVPGSWSDWLLVHCNYVDDSDIRLMAEKQASVAYCPVASQYFGHTDHPYRKMIESGVNVSLGTDSAICQSADDPDKTGLWAAARLLYQRDGTDPKTLLAMASVNGAKALGIQAWYASNSPVTFVETGGASTGDLLACALTYRGRSFDGWGLC